MGRPGTMRVVAAVALGLITVLAGCAKASPVTSTSSATQTSKVSGSTPVSSTPTGPYGTLTMAASTFDVERFNTVATGTGSKARLFGPMTDWMFWMEVRDGPQQPAIVEKWEIAPDGLSWTLRVRKGVKFHNGDDLTGKDVKFSIEQYMTKEAATPDMRNAVNRVEMVDDWAVRVVTKGKQPLLQRILSVMVPSYGMVIPKDYIEKNGWPYFEQHPVGSGPFTFVRHNRGDSAEYEANTKYWAQAPAFKNLKIVLIPEEATRVAALKSGQVDIIENIGFGNIKEMEAKGFPKIVQDKAASRVQLHGAYDPRAKGTPVSDLKVRQALSLAINRDEINKTFYYGEGSFPLPSAFSSASEDIDTAYMQTYAAKIWRYDQAAAKALLKDAGYANGFNIRFYTFDSTAAPDNPKLALIVQAYWSQIGVKAEIVAIDQGRYKTMSAPLSNDFVGQATTHGIFSSPPSNLTSGFAPSGATGLLGTAFPQFDELMAAWASEMDSAKRKEILARVITMTTETYTMLMVSNFSILGAMGPRVTHNLQAPLPVSSLPVFASYFKHGKAP
ncbi:MAG: ABC transporter substrate-binding protein [Chloroflexi bacterium]|nr:ABC transporter substrate-binding protein [Chloroflexota bacterium]